MDSSAVTIQDNATPLTINTACSVDQPETNQTMESTSRQQQTQRPPRIFKMGKGYVRHKPGSTAAERKQFWEKVKYNPQLKDDPTKRPVSDSWLFYNDKLMGKPMQLYASQIMELVKLLPTAFEAAKNNDTSYFEVITEGKTNRLTLEIYFYKDTLNLSVKKYFIPEDKVDDDHQEWLPTSSYFSFNHEKDEPTDLLEYVLLTSEN